MLIRMIASRALNRRFCTFIDITANQALPKNRFFSLPDGSLLELVKIGLETIEMVLFDLSDCSEVRGDDREAFLVGGLFLIWKKVIHWQIPVAMLLTLTIFCYCNLADCAANLSITVMATLFRRNNVRCLFYCYRSGNGIYYAKRKIIIR